MARPTKPLQQHKIQKQVYLSMELLEWIRAEALDRGCSESQVIVDCIEQVSQLGMAVPFVRGPAGAPEASGAGG